MRAYCLTRPYKEREEGSNLKLFNITYGQVIPIFKWTIYESVTLVNLSVKKCMVNIIFNLFINRKV